MPVSYSVHQHPKRASTGRAHTILAINILTTSKYFEIRGLREMAGNHQQLCLPCIRALHPCQLLYPYSWVTSMGWLPHSVSFESDFFKLPLEACFLLALWMVKSPSTLFMSSTTSIGLFADLIKMNRQQWQGQGLSSATSAAAGSVVQKDPYASWWELPSVRSGETEFPNPVILSQEVPQNRTDQSIKYGAKWLAGVKSTV